MTDVQPTTVYELERKDRSPCCDAQLVLASPPNGYECRECYESYNLSDGAASPESEPSEETECPEVMTNGDVCGRERPCQYHD